MKKDDEEKNKPLPIQYEGLDELKSSCPEGTTLTGPTGSNGETITVNGQAEAVCISPDGTRNGPFIKWFRNGKKAVKGNYKNNNKSGEWTYWSELGNKIGKGSFNNDKPEGKWHTWHENGALESEGEYHRGLQNGTFIYWDDKKNISKTLHYKMGKIIKSES
jgi:antitoxin component YwqK of YwqJK toxin-antitoxin module